MSIYWQTRQDFFCGGEHVQAYFSPRQTSTPYNKKKKNNYLNNLWATTCYVHYIN